MEYFMEFSWNIMEYWWNMYGLLWTILDIGKKKGIAEGIDAIWSLGDFGQTKNHQIKGTLLGQMAYLSGESQTYKL